VSPYVLLAAGILAAAAIGGAGWQGYRMGMDAEIAAQAREDRAAKTATDAALRVTAEAIAGIQVRHTTIRQPVEREIRENTVYRECRHSADAFGLLNRALEDAPAGTSAPGGGKLPEADTPR
jgi:hypothetical protein